MRQTGGPAFSLRAVKTPGIICQFIMQAKFPGGSPGVRAVRLWTLLLWTAAVKATPDRINVANSMVHGLCRVGWFSVHQEIPYGHESLSSQTPKEKSLGPARP